MSSPEPTNPGEYALTLTPVTVLGTDLASVNVVLRITPSCEGDYISITPPTFAADEEYTLSFATKTILTTWTIVPDNCRVTYAAVIPSVIQTPVTFDTITTDITVATQLVSATSYVGVHEIEVVPSTPGGVAVEASKATFNLDIAIPCEPPALQVSMQSVPDVLHVLDASAFTLSTVWTANMASCTPAFTAELKNEAGDAPATDLITAAILTWDSVTLSFAVASTSDTDLIGKYTIVITPSSPTTTVLTADVATINFEIVDPCELPAIGINAQADFTEHPVVQGASTTLDVSAKFTVVPNTCGVTYAFSITGDAAT